MPMYEATFEHDISLQMTMEQAMIGSHSGDCELDVKYLMGVPEIAKQLVDIDPSKLSKVLDEYGCWDEGELADHQANLMRLVWIAAGDITDGQGYQLDEEEKKP